MTKRGQDQFRHLVALGKRKGFVTYDEVEACLCPRPIPPEHLDRLLWQLVQEEIELRDLGSQAGPAAPASTVQGRTGPRVEKGDTEPASRSDPEDPLGSYLRGMGKLSLLTREGEVELCREIEEGERAILEAMPGSRLGLTSLERLVERIGSEENPPGRPAPVLHRAVTMSACRAHGRHEGVTRVNYNFQATGMKKVIVADQGVPEHAAI